MPTPRQAPDWRRAANRLRYFRRRAGLRQQDLAELVGMPPARVSRLETQPLEWQKVRPDELRTLAEVLEVEPEELTGAPANADQADETDEEAEPEQSQGLSENPPREAARAGRGGIADARRTWDIRRPLSTDADRPRPDHLGEPWDRQGLCLLETLRRAYIEWVDDPDYDDARPDVGALVERLANAATQWAVRHGMARPDATDYAAVGADTPMWTLAEDGLARIRGNVEAGNVPVPWTTEYVMMPWDKAPSEVRHLARVDIVRAADGQLLAIGCPHATPSNDPARHGWKPPEDQGRRESAAPKGRKDATGGEREFLF